MTNTLTITRPKVKLLIKTVDAKVSAEGGAAAGEAVAWVAEAWAKKDDVLLKTAKIAEEILIDMKVPGVKI